MISLMDPGFLVLPMWPQQRKGDPNYCPKATRVVMAWWLTMADGPCPFHFTTCQNIERWWMKSGHMRESCQSVYGQRGGDVREEWGSAVKLLWREMVSLGIEVEESENTNPFPHLFWGILGCRSDSSSKGRLQGGWYVLQYFLRQTATLVSGNILRVSIVWVAGRWYLM